MEHKNFCLEVLKGKSKGQTFSLSADSITIGRKLAPKEKKKDWLLFEDQSLARIHAILIWDEEKSLFRAVQKSEGKTIKVNGALVKEAYLYHLDKIQLGDVILRIWDGPVDTSLLEPEELEEPLTEDKEEIRMPAPASEREVLPPLKPEQDSSVIPDTALIKPDKNETRPLKYSKLITPSESSNIKSFSFFTNKTDKQEKGEAAQVNFKPVDLFKSSVVKNLNEGSDFQPISIVRPYDGNSIVGMKKASFAEMSFNEKAASFDPQYAAVKPVQLAKQFFSKEEHGGKTTVPSSDAPEDNKSPLSSDTHLSPHHSTPGIFTDKTLFKTGSDTSDSDDIEPDISNKISPVQNQKSNKYSFGQFGRKKPLPPIKGLSPSEGFIAEEPTDNILSSQETVFTENKVTENQFLPDQNLSQQNIPQQTFDSAFEESLSQADASLPSGDISAFDETVEDEMSEDPPIPGFENLTHDNFLNSGRRGLAYISGDVLNALVSGEEVPASQSSSSEETAKSFLKDDSQKADLPKAWEGSLLSSNAKDSSNPPSAKNFLHPRGGEEIKPNIPGSLFSSRNAAQEPRPDILEEDVTFTQNAELHLQVDISDAAFNMPEIKNFDPSTFDLGEKITDSDPSFQKFNEPNLDFSKYTSSDIFKNTLEETETKSERISEPLPEPPISKAEQTYSQSLPQEKELSRPPSFSSAGRPPYLPEETTPYGSVLYPKKKQVHPFKIKAKKISRLHLPSEAVSDAAEVKSSPLKESARESAFENKNSMRKEPISQEKQLPQYDSAGKIFKKEENTPSKNSSDNIDIKFSPDLQSAQIKKEDSQMQSTPAFFGFSKEELLGDLPENKNSEEKIGVSHSWDAIAGNTLSFSSQTSQELPPMHSPVQEAKNDGVEVPLPVVQEAEKEDKKENKDVRTSEAKENPSYFDNMIKKYNLPPIIKNNEAEEFTSANIFPVNEINEKFEVKPLTPSLPLGKPFSTKPMINFDNLSIDGMEMPKPKWSLKFIKSPEGEKLFNIEHDEIFIGRIKGIDVTFDDLQLADRHIKLYTYEDKLYLQKLEKNRPILINGNPLVTAAGRVLQPGDTVKLSDRIIFVVQKDI